MRKSYADFLKEQGASEDEVKLLDTAPARKAYNALMDKAEADAALAAKAKTDLDAYDKWYQDEAVPAYKKMEGDLTVAKANEARAATAIRTMQERGLIDVAKDLGYDPDKPPAPPANPALPTGFDPSKYVTSDVLMQVAEKEGDAIAIAQDIAFEHSRLFPDRPLNFRELRKEAVAAKKPVEQLWKEKYGVDAARAAKAKSEQDTRDAKLREEGAAAERAKYANAANPDLRSPATSNSPFIPRKEGDRAGKQPWDLNENDTASSRVRNATTKVMEKIQ
jgi:hypothetical protein